MEQQVAKAPDGRPVPRWVPRWVYVGLAVLVLVVTGWLLGAHQKRLHRTPRSKGNAAFAERASFSESMERFGCKRPPGYPAVLFATRRVGLSPKRVGWAAFYASLVGLFVFCRRFVRGVHPGWPVAAYALGGYHLFNLAQYEDVALFTPLSIGALLATAVYVERPSTRAAVVAGIVCGAASLVRTDGLVWLFPLAAAATVLRPGLAWTARALHLGCLSAITLVPSALWMAYVHERTGFLTGMDRSAPRDLGPGHAHWMELNDAWPTVKLTVLTYYVDFLSPTVNASHEALDEILDGALPLGPGEIAGLLALAVATAFAARPLLARRDEGAAPRPGRLVTSTGWLVACYLALFVGGRVALWALSNNDPIYTRFLYPSYPFVVVGAALAYAAAARETPSTRLRSAFLALFAVVVCIHLFKGVSFALGGA